jgi:hypothetical protein
VSMADELATLCGNISLMEREKIGISITEGDVLDAREKGVLCLIDHIWFDKNINREAFKAMLI